MFVADVTLPDNVAVNPLAPYTKTWHIRNVGTCPWTAEYKLVFVRGTRMGAPESIPFPGKVLPGHSVNLSVSFIAPGDIGVYESYWMFQTPEGLMFGVGALADKPIWLKVRVVAPAATPTVPAALPASTATQAAAPTVQPEIVAYDFVASVCQAQWTNNEGPLPCPGSDGDPNGFVIASDHARLENEVTLQLPTLIMFPSASAEGYIQGIYPEYEIQAGDRLEAMVGCENGYFACSVLFRVAYADSSGNINDLWSIGEFYDGHYFNLGLDLSPLAGRKARLILSVSSLGNAEGDRALWVGPRIVRHWTPTATNEPTFTPIPTETPPAASSTPTFTPTLAPPTATLTPVVDAGDQESPSIFQRIIEAIVSFFRKLFGL
ncbi:MAG: NBR1-Ig-like domain-containing protein [Chloroflexota bacterium]